MKEWIVDGIQGKNLKSTIRLYLFNLGILTPIASLIAITFSLYDLFVLTPILIVLVVCVEYVVVSSLTIKVKFSFDIYERFVPVLKILVLCAGLSLVVLFIFRATANKSLNKVALVLDRSSSYTDPPKLLNNVFDSIQRNNPAEIIIFATGDKSTGNQPILIQDVSIPTRHRVLEVNNYFEQKERLILELKYRYSGLGTST